MNMKIKSVYIKRWDKERTFIFDTKLNLIFSKENSKGKTTLLRLILYGFGYNIPATDGVKTFDDFYVKIEYENNNSFFTIERYMNNINFYEGGAAQAFIVPEQLEELHALIFDITDTLILNNLLAIFYIDQEKGWTLLNRGIIIGKNRFNIEEFISGLSDKDISSINNELEEIKNEIKKYKYLKNIAEYKKGIVIDKTVNYSKQNDLELYSKKNVLMTKKQELIHEVEEINTILKDNKKLIQYLEKLDIYVKISENENVKVSKDNILNYNENQIYYETRRKELEIKLTKVKKELNKIEDEIESRNTLFNVKTVLEEVDDMMKNVNVNENQVDKIIDQLIKRQKSLNKSLRAILANNNNYLSSIFQSIRKYATELGIGEYIKDDYNFVLTNQLKGKSGKILTQMSFIFKIAYVLEIKKKYNIKLPLIIDSPRTNELTDEASTAMLKILERDFGDHQIIFASVYPFEEIKTTKIEMKNNLFD